MEEALCIDLRIRDLLYRISVVGGMEVQTWLPGAEGRGGISHRKIV